MRLRTLVKVAQGVMVFGVCTSAAVFAQGQADSANKAPGGYDGRYTLGASNDTLYLLDGDSAVFKKLNARMVKVTGLVSEPSRNTSEHNVLSQQPPTLTVQSLKKVADGCN
jgi:hypothetical protein